MLAASSTVWTNGTTVLFSVRFEKSKSKLAPSVLKLTVLRDGHFGGTEETVGSKGGFHFGRDSAEDEPAFGQHVKLDQNDTIE